MYITSPELASNWKFVPLTTFTHFLEWRLIPNPSCLTHQHGRQAMVPESTSLPSISHKTLCSKFGQQSGKGCCWSQTGKFIILCLSTTHF